LLERLESQASAFTVEEKLLLQQICQSLELLPWNRKALQSACRLEELVDEVQVDSGHADLPLAFFSSVSGMLTPHPPSWSHTWINEGNGNSNEMQEEGTSHFARGVHAAAEIREGLADVSNTLHMHDVQHRLVLDNLIVGAYIHSQFGDDEVPIRFLWGSSVHYAEIPGSNKTRLLPAARFQVTALQAESDARVIVIPHWSWPTGGDGESKARCLLNLAQQSPVSTAVSSQSCAFQ